MSRVKRLVTFADLDNRATAGSSIRARHELEMDDGSRVVLLDDRGWGPVERGERTTLEDIKRTTRMVVGPDGPPEGRTNAEEARLHWEYLQEVARRKGVLVDSTDLSALPHDVELSARLLAFIA